MYKNKKILGLIPARGGSKGLPGKNIRLLLRKPLIAWTIEQALRSKYLDDIVLTTDDRRIAATGKKFGAEVPFMRPASLATDRAKSIDVIIHALNWLKEHGRNYDYIVLLEPTSPLRETIDIDRAIEQLLNNSVGAVSIVGVSQVEATHPAFDVKIDQRGLLKPYEQKKFSVKRRQDLDPLYYFEGTVYVSEVKVLYERLSFYHDKTLPYIVPRWKAPELDEVVDFYCIESIMKNLKKIKEAEG